LSSASKVYGAQGYHTNTGQESNESSKLTFCLTPKVGYSSDYNSANCEIYWQQFGVHGAPPNYPILEAVAQTHQSKLRKHSGQLEETSLCNRLISEIISLSITDLATQSAISCNDSLLMPDNGGLVAHGI
jgi:hypothetical protein